MLSLGGPALVGFVGTFLQRRVRRASPEVSPFAPICAKQSGGSVLKGSLRFTARREPPVRAKLMAYLKPLERFYRRLVDEVRRYVEGVFRQVFHRTKHTLDGADVARKIVEAVSDGGANPRIGAMEQPRAARFVSQAIVDRALCRTARKGDAVYFDPVLFLNALKCLKHRRRSETLRLRRVFFGRHVGADVAQSLIGRRDILFVIR